MLKIVPDRLHSSKEDKEAHQCSSKASRTQENALVGQAFQLFPASLEFLLVDCWR